MFCIYNRNLWSNYWPKLLNKCNEVNTIISSRKILNWNIVEYCLSIKQYEMSKIHKTYSKCVIWCTGYDILHHEENRRSYFTVTPCGFPLVLHKNKLEGFHSFASFCANLLVHILVVREKSHCGGRLWAAAQHEFVKTDPPTGQWGFRISMLFFLMRFLN